MAHCRGLHFALFTAFYKKGQTNKNGMSFYAVRCTREETRY
jgi:hypothetical protein